MQNLSGKSVVISGVARGMGRSHALAVARAGGRVAGVDVCQDVPGVRYPLATKEDLDSLAAELTDLGADFALEVMDVRDADGLRAFVQAADADLGPVEGVVANAGVWDLHGPLWEVEPSTWSTVLDITLNGSLNLLRAAAPSMLRHERGSVVFIGSVNSFEPHQQTGSYVVAKHGVIGLMRQAAVELAAYNIRANAVCPGVVDTRIWNNGMGYGRPSFGADAGRDGGVDRVYGTHLLAGRSSLPSSAITEAVMWLLSDASEHITGVSLPVDAGHAIMSGFNHDPQRTGQHAERYRPPTETPL